MRLLLILALLLAPAAAHADELTVFAAASLTDAIHDVAALWEAAGHQPFRASFAASSTLAHQIEQGAPANLFASADEKWMDDVAEHGLIATGSRIDLLGNDLVLVVPSDKPTHVTIGPGFDLAAMLGSGGRLAVGDPAHVPAGIYAEQALRKLGLWNSVAARLAPAEDVRSALLLVERGEALAGIVYGTDAAASMRVSVAGAFPPDSHDPITYPFALTKAGDTPEARALLAFMHSDAAEAAFQVRGFKIE